MKGIIRFFANVFKPKYTYSLQKIPPVKENGFYMLKETGSHSCIQAKADEILNTDFIYNIDPHDIIYIIKFEENEVMENRKYKVIEERRGFSFTLQNAYSKKIVSGQDIITDQNISDKIDSTTLIKIAYAIGLKDGRLISKEILKSDRAISSKSKNLKVIK